MLKEKPSKCISSKKVIEVNAQIHYIDFEGRSDGESTLKILSQLRPRRVIVVGGLEQSAMTVAKHCEQNIGARVFTPKKGEIVDATTETHIFQVRLTEGLVSSLQFQKAKDSEVAWIDARVGLRNKTVPAQELDDAHDTIQMQVDPSEDTNILTLEPLKEDEVPIHNSVLINELKLTDFKQFLMRHNISSEIVSGVLWCANGALALRRVDTGKVTIEGCLSEDYYKIRELLYEQYAIV